MNRRDLQAIDQARRAAGMMLTMLDLGFSVEDAIQVTQGAALTPRSIQAAGTIARRIRHDLEGLSFGLTGQVDDSVLACFEIAEAPPDETLALLFGPASPTVTTRTEAVVSDLDYMRGAGIDPKLAPGAKPEPPGDRP